MSGIHIVAIGARTPVGLLAESTAAAIRGHISRLREHPFMVDKNGDPLVTAVDARLDPKLLGVDRLVGMAVPALTEVINKLVASRARLPVVDVFLALPEARPGFIDVDFDLFGRRLVAATETLQPRPTWHLAGRGHAGVVAGIAAATERLRAGTSTLCVVGGVDSYLHADTLNWLAQHDQLAGPDVRSGFHPGEAASFIALASDSMRSAFGLPSLGVVRGVAVTQEQVPIKTDGACRGVGLADALLAACQALRLPAESPGMVFCDINGERYRSEEWGMAQLRLGERLTLPDFRTPTDCIGDVGAATGAILCTLATWTWARGFAQGRHALVFTGSESGQRGAVLIEQPAVGV